MRFRSLIPYKLRFSDRFSRSKESRSVSQAETVIHNFSNEKLPELSAAKKEVEQPFSAWHYAIHGPEIDFSTWIDDTVAPQKATSETGTTVYEASNGAFSDFVTSEDIVDPQEKVSIYKEKYVAASAYDSRGNSRNSVSDTETIIHNFSNKESSGSFTFENTAYHQEKVAIFKKDGAVDFAEGNIDTYRKSISETETIIHNSPNRESSGSVTFEENTHHHEKTAPFKNNGTVDFTENSIDTSRESASETETIVHNSNKIFPELLTYTCISSVEEVVAAIKKHGAAAFRDERLYVPRRPVPKLEATVHTPLDKKSTDSATFENTINNQKDIAAFEEKNVATSNNSVTATETVTHSPSKEESLESAISEDFNHHKLWQGKRWTPSEYSLSIYSQDGIDEVPCTLKTKEIKELKQMLLIKQMEIDELHRANSKQSEKSVSEMETTIHIPMDGKSSESFISEYSIDEPKVTDITRRQRCRNKLRRYLTSTQELIAPLKALHPNNRPEKGHTKTTRQQQKEAIEARYAPVFFKSVPLDSTEEGEASMFYGSKPVEEQTLPAAEQAVEEKPSSFSGQSVRVKYSAEDYIGFIKDLTDDFLEVSKPFADKYLEVAKPLADDYLGVTGFNLRTGDLDSSEEHIIPRRRRVHWGTIENGWESTDCPVIIEAFDAPNYPAVEAYFPIKTYSPVKTYTPVKTHALVQAHAPVQTYSPIEVKKSSATKCVSVMETVKSPQSTNITEKLSISEAGFLGGNASRFCMSTATSTTTTGEDILAWREMVWH
ncbi:hypothetical protein DID88_006278 [Monilinia fructigena]|uniref:Uncharacterized protein n=1 Tax=Monilinia fructigena TaxID=38457 RepID=A0A395J375_9HELO|nr:hypothetical protein DID88_006278 [Monilinia fructigena]